jgi:hypothetical protein
LTTDGTLERKLARMAGCGSEVEHLPSIYKALGLIPITARKEERKGGREEGRNLARILSTNRI